MWVGTHVFMFVRVYVYHQTSTYDLGTLTKPSSICKGKRVLSGLLRDEKFGVGTTG